MYLAAAIAPRRRGKPARRQSGPLGKPSAQRFIPFNGSLCRETMGKLAGHQNTCERDTSRNRTCTAVQGRFYNPPGAQVGIGRATCARRKSQNALVVNYLNIFLRVHVFALNMIQSSYNLQADLITDLHPRCRRFAIYNPVVCRVFSRLLPCSRRRSPTSGSRNIRIALYCRQVGFRCSRSTEIRFKGSAPRLLMQAQLQRCSTSISFRLAASLARFASKSP